MDVAVIVGTFGGDEWVELAHSRAIPSAQDQAPVFHQHGETLAVARNTALALVDTEFVIHLDADDELEPGYVDAMAKGSADLRAPMVRQIRNGRAKRPPFMPQVWNHHHACAAECLPEGNWLVIGTAVRAQMVRNVGGWWEERVYEDWSVFLRCYLAGATVEATPEAIYRAHVSIPSRNHSLSQEESNRIHHEIVASCT